MWKQHINPHHKGSKLENGGGSLQTLCVNHSNLMHWSASDSARAQKLDDLLLSFGQGISWQQQATETATVKLTKEPSSHGLQGNLWKTFQSSVISK